MSYPKENLVPALLLVLGAGASTGIGAAVVFFPSLVKLANRRVLAASLGFSAGVMTYVSFVEIFGKAEESFVNAGHEENTAYIYATLCFFGGVGTMLLLNATVDWLHSKIHKNDNENASEKKKPQSTDSLNNELSNSILEGPTCHSSDPVKRLNNVQKMGNVIENQKRGGRKARGSVIQQEIDEISAHSRVEADADSSKPFEDKEAVEEVVDEDKSKRMTEEVMDEENIIVETPKDEEKERLHKMGLNTAIAIGLHNFPEGLATFVAALQDPKVGAILAIAIAIHNIPEGLCVALPIYYASENRMKGFLWALLSGASEFVAALLGWAILANAFSESAYAILFGLVGGMMIMISMKELLPTAHIYDNGDSVVSYSFIVGMVVMALSLCLFQI